MICLYCESPLPSDRPQTCACEVEHRDRPPVAGINHVSQVLCAIDDLRSGDLELEEMEGVVDVFLALFEGFEAKWRPNGTSLLERLTPTMQERFATTMSGIDKALEEGGRALEILQGLEPEALDAQLEEAEAALVAFFQNACGHAAAALDDFDSLKAQLQSSGAFFNMRSR